VVFKDLRRHRTEHLAHCTFWICSRCFSKIPRSKCAQHMSECAYWYCASYGLPLTNREEHLDNCKQQYKRCNQCGKRAIPRDQYLDHIISCETKRCQAVGNVSIRTSMKQTTSINAHNSDAHSVGLSSLRSIRRLPGLIRVMISWFQSPLRNMMADFEFFPYSGARLGTVQGFLPYQIALANAHGEWIVLVTVINHGITKRAMLERCNELKVSCANQ
jgi:hypothetical protein